MKTMSSAATIAHGAGQAQAPTFSFSRVIATGLARLSHYAAARRMRTQLAQMDDRLLVDIGIAPDEIHRIRAGERFVPRDWRGRMEPMRNQTF